MPRQTIKLNKGKERDRNIEIIFRRLLARWKTAVKVALLVLYKDFKNTLKHYNGTRAQRSTRSKKIWLFIHPRNFGSDKIVRPYVHPFM